MEQWMCRVTHDGRHALLKLLVMKADMETAGQLTASSCMIVMASFTRIATFSLSEYSSTRSGQTVLALSRIRMDQSGSVTVEPLEAG